MAPDVQRDALPDALLNGEPAAWEAFVRRYGALVVAAIRGVAAVPGEVEDLAQEVFLRLCKDDFRLLRSYDPARAAISTWITIVARSTARDALRRRRAEAVPLDAVPEAQLAIDPVEPQVRLKLPEALLSPRQREILTMLYDREMEVGEVARALGIDPQTVRSAHHKAMLKLRAHFKAELE
ncbi:MAG TPA: sigma-70 family RNA polymerase sigma factor [Stellaceae bacterium]|nr:sigma-70 family RNA polymerase sigma factor [Stellaceae bacterium]